MTAYMYVNLDKQLRAVLRIMEGDYIISRSDALTDDSNFYYEVGGLIYALSIGHTKNGETWSGERCKLISDNDPLWNEAKSWLEIEVFIGEYDHFRIKNK